MSPFAATDWAGFERVTVVQGKPEQGGTALIRGIDAKTGGHGWFTWQAPTQPGTYTLVAQLQEHHNDAAPGNNEATVEIVVEAGPRLPYRRFLGAISRGAIGVVYAACGAAGAPHAACPSAGDAGTA